MIIMIIIISVIIIFLHDYVGYINKGYNLNDENNSGNNTAVNEGRATS